MKCAVKGKRGVYKWLVSVCYAMVYPVVACCVVRSWPPVHELGVYVLVGLYLLHHHRGQESTVERRFIQWKRVVCSFVASRPRTRRV